MFPFDSFAKNAHDLSLAAKLVNSGADWPEPKPQAVRAGATRRLVLALSAAAPIMLGLAWLFMS